LLGLFLFALIQNAGQVNCRNIKFTHRSLSFFAQGR
jgi:hypothetical protein